MIRNCTGLNQLSNVLGVITSRRIFYWGRNLRPTTSRTPWNIEQSLISVRQARNGTHIFVSKGIFYPILQKYIKSPTLHLTALHIMPSILIRPRAINDNVTGTQRLTHWGRDKMAAIFLTTFSNAFSWMKMYEFRLRFHWNVFRRFELTIFHYWFR